MVLLEQDFTVLHTLRTPEALTLWAPEFWVPSLLTTVPLSCWLSVGWAGVVGKTSPCTRVGGLLFRAFGSAVIGREFTLF